MNQQQIKTDRLRKEYDQTAESKQQRDRQDKIGE
jgi:hypothetical protein